MTEYADVWKMKDYLSNNLHEFPWHVFSNGGVSIDAPMYAPPYLTAVRILNIVSGSRIPETVESWYIKQYKEGNYEVGPIVTIIGKTHNTEGEDAGLCPADKLAKVMLDTMIVRDFIAERLQVKQTSAIHMDNWAGVTLSEEFQIT